MMNNSILKPDMKVAYLRNRAKEKVTYLQIPKDVNVSTLAKDIKQGAAQFSQLLTQLKKEEQSQYIIIEADNLEMGYMAVMYHAACMNSLGAEHEDMEEQPEYSDKPDFEWFQGFDEEKEDDDETGDAQEWKESPFRIPVIEAMDVRRNLCQQTEDYFFNSFSMQQNNAGVNDRPYWMDCKTEPVCIVNCNIGFCTGLDEETAKNLDYFKNNRYVYILFIEEKNQFAEIDDDCETDWGFNGTAIKNEVILSYLADEVTVRLEKEQEKKYYKYLFRQCLKRNGLQVGKGFSYERVVNLIMSMKKNEVCDLINKIIRYAQKEKGKNAGNKLVTEDFRFIDKFSRTKGFDKDKKERSAREHLMKDLVGMDSIKEQVLDVVNVMKYNRLREKMKIAAGNYHNVHMMLGAPGTAKTTVARLMGEIMLEEKLLPDDRFICVNGAELKGMYVGHSAPKTKALFENYDVIVIDEAYSLVDESGTTDSFSREAIAQLIIELENHSTDKLVIFAGYGGNSVTDKNNKMQDFINANPGIKSRITSTFCFESYTADEMVCIFKHLAKMQKYQLEAESEELLRNFFQERTRDENFGNGREARSLLETSVLFAAKRVMNSTKNKPEAKELQSILTDDIRQAIQRTRKSYQLQNKSVHRRIGF